VVRLSLGLSYPGENVVDFIRWDTAYDALWLASAGRRGKILVTKCLVKPIVMSPSEFDHQPYAAEKHHDAV
jgi:hypothetical protein